MDPFLDLQAWRLVASAALTAHALKSLGGRIAADSDADDLLLQARRLGREVGLLERRHRFSFDPPYPGVTAGVEDAGGTLRLVLACTACSLEAQPLGVAFTTLIPGRLPQVSVAPLEAPVSKEWRPLADLL